MGKNTIPFKKIKIMIQNSGFFDKIYYLKNNRDARLAIESPIDHYCKIGIKEDRNLNAIFDPVWYKEYYKDVKENGTYPIIHFIIFGITENRFMNSLELYEYNSLKNSTQFNEGFYKNKYEDLKVQKKGFNYLLHFIRFGKKEGRVGSSSLVVQKKKKSTYDIIKESSLFNESYYKANYLDVKNTGIDPLRHYISHGVKEGRNPNSTFDTDYYLNKYKDVKNSNINPLLHYIQHGEQEGRKTNNKLETYLSEYSNYIKLRDLDTDINVAVIVHIYYTELWKDILEKLKNIKHSYTLYITTTNELYNNVKELEMPNVEVKIFKYKNIGMDVYPFVQVLKNLYEDNINIFCKLHTKKGNDHTGNIWNKTLLEHNIGNNEIFSGIAHALNEDENLRMVGSAFFYKNIKYLIGNNSSLLEKILTQLNISSDTIEKNGFFAGSMFWGKVSDYKILWENISDESFRNEKNMSNTDGSFSHILERLLGLVHKKDKKIGVVYKGNLNNEYFLEKLVNNNGIMSNISDTIAQISDIEYDYSLLKNFRFFNKEDYNQYFTHLNGHGIDYLYHYLTIGRFFYTKEFSTNILNLFNYGDKKLLPSIHIALNGSQYEHDLSDNSNLDYEFSRIKVGVHETNLIDWNIEHKKSKNDSLISIVIPVYGQAELTDNCIESILEKNAGSNYEIIIVNNGQDENDIISLNKWNKFPNIKIIHNEENLNFALGCNLGFSRSIGSKVVFLNNDTTVTDDWLKNLVLPLENENISITQPKLLYPDGNLQCMGVVFSDKSKLAYPIYQNQDVPKRVLEENKFFNAVTGACLAVSSEDFALVRGFDTHYINGQEDIDFCLKLNRLKKTKAMYVASSTVYHYEGKSTGRGKFVVNNRKYFINKWKNKIIQDDQEHYQMDGADVTQWELDSKVFKEMGIENYIPVIKFRDVIADNRLLQEIPTGFMRKGSLLNDKNKKTILLSSHSVGKQIFGGERSFLDMAKAIDKLQYNLIITVPNQNNEEYIKLLLNYSSFIYTVDYKMWSIGGVNSNLVKLLENIMLLKNIDMVYTNTIMCKESLIAAQNLHIKRVIHVRELIDKDKDLRDVISQNTENIISEIVSSSDFLITNSKITNNMFNSKNRGIVYNQIETEHYKNIENNINNEKIKFTMISSNIPKKGIYEFVKIAKLSKNILNAHFILIGPENDFIQEIKESLIKEEIENITIAGYYSNPIEAIKESNVILSLSSFAESFGRTVGEASAGGRPVIAYNYGAIPELVEHGQNGFLASYKNLEEIVKYIDILCTNPDKIIEMGEKGREIINKISSPKVYTTQLNDLLKKSFDIKEIEEKNINLTIIIPIYNAYNEVINCIDSVLNSLTNLSTKLLLIDDYSSDKRIKPMLKKYNELFNVEVIYNSENIGYTNTVNKGIHLAKERDVILLNSDTIVTFNWINSLRSIAYSKKDIGTVTAMSDNAGAFSFPKQSVSNPKPKKMEYNSYANILLRKSHKVLPVEVPTGSGFCFYIKRDLITNIGLFDHEAFPRGYGEENDFCMRAIQNGWKNVIASNSLIFHIRTASFGNEKDKLVKEGVATVIQRYPNYNEDVQKAFSSKEMTTLRVTTQNAIDYLL